MVVYNNLSYCILTYRAEVSFLVEFEALNAGSVIPDSLCQSVQDPWVPNLLLEVMFPNIFGDSVSSIIGSRTGGFMSPTAD